MKDERSSVEQELAEIDARISNNHVLLKVQCAKRKGVLVKLISKIESFNLMIDSINVAPFGSLDLNVIIVAEMEKEFRLTVKEVVTVLRAAA